MIYCGRGLDLGWEWALTRKPSMLAQQCSLQLSGIAVKGEQPVVASFSTPPLIMPLGRTPPYLDPESQEAMYEVDVSGVPTNVYLNRNQDMRKLGHSSERGLYL